MKEITFKTPKPRPRSKHKLRFESRLKINIIHMVKLDASSFDGFWTHYNMTQIERAWFAKFKLIGLAKKF